MEKRICIFGDSITWGAWDPEKGGWGSRLRNYFESNDFDTALYNCGVSGNKTIELLKRFDVESEARKPEIIIFAIGINDLQYIDTPDNFKTPLSVFQENIEILLEKAKKQTKTIIFLSITKVDETKTTPSELAKNNYYLNNNIKTYNSKIEEICYKNNVSWVDVYNLLEEVDLCDGLHPNSQGHKKIFLKVKDFLLDNNLINL